MIRIETLVVVGIRTVVMMGGDCVNEDDGASGSHGDDNVDDGDSGDVDGINSNTHS